MNAPVLLLIFNRPSLTMKVFEAVRAAKPPRLFIAADGPRLHMPREADMCFATRALVEAAVDWPCEIKTFYRSDNLGCQKAVGSAISWFFSEVEEGIVLEDDTFPDGSFFTFCETLLERHRGDEKVMHISGNNYQGKRVRGDGAYYASQFAHSWGWATWARAWKKYDPEMSGFPQDWDDLSKSLNYSHARADWWKQSLQATIEGKINTWDWQWHYTIMKDRGICLLPQVNLVQNIGVGWHATHTVRHTNTTRTKARKLMPCNAPSSLRIMPEWDEFDFQHSVMNKRYPWRSLKERIEYCRFCIG